MTTVEEFIAHHGVKGMRWGVRRPRGKSVRPASSESKKVEELRKRKPKQLTNRQLQTVNTRLNLERNFKSLNPNNIEKGHNFAKGVLGLATTAAGLYALSTTPAGKALIEKGKKFLEKKV